MADQAVGGVAGQETAKATRVRSPNYPSMGLREAVTQTEALYKGGAMAPLIKISALKLLGYEKLHGEAGRVLSALKSFGLVEETNDRIKLSQRGIDIAARLVSDARRLAALREAALAPQIYNELITEYKGSLPLDAALKSELIAAKHFNPNAVGGFLEDFRDTLEYSGISYVRVLDSGNEGKEHEQPPPAPPAIGDYVQWESQGQVQFSEPKRVRALSPDGQWAFVDGSDTGLPVSEVTVMDAPSTAIEKPPDPPKPKVEKQWNVPQQAPKMRSYIWALSGDFNAKLDLFGEARTEEDIDALTDYVEITVKALKRSLKTRTTEGQ